MKAKEKLAFRKPNHGDYRFCKSCKRLVILPCVACRTNAWLEARQAEKEFLEIKAEK
jgi:hypothetical protein